MSSDGAILRVVNIYKHFPGVKALSNVSFDVLPGEVHSLCGENGAGKSTLIKILTGAHARDGGDMFFDGRQVELQSTHAAMELGIACIYQELTIVPQMDIANNLFIGNLPMDKKGVLVDNKALYSKSAEILARVGLDVEPTTPAGELSLAQQQLVEIGRALTRNARVIIMDEPTSSLSDREAQRLLELIRELAAGGIAIIYISHKLDEVLSIADRITVLRDGMNIITMPAKEVTREMLISNMIGRDLESMYPRHSGTPGDTLLKVDGLTSPGVFENISFELRRGEVLGMFGLVGAGRSEIIRAIYGVDKYAEGSVVLDGVPVPRHDPGASVKRGIGYAPEDRKKEGLMLGLSILVNMTLVKLPQISRLGVISRRKQRELSSGFRDSISIKTPSLNQAVGNLSGGNQQKVIIAKWLMMEPKLLILDEPTRGIDVGSKAEIYKLIAQLADNGIGVIVVSSEIEELLGICDRIITVSEGRITSTAEASGLSSDAVLAAAIGGGNS